MLGATAAEPPALRVQPLDGNNNPVADLFITHVLRPILCTVWSFVPIQIRVCVFAEGDSVKLDISLHENMSRKAVTH